MRNILSLLVLCVLLGCGQSVVVPTVEAADALAVKAQAVLKQHCFSCQGEGGSNEGGFNFVALWLARETVRMPLTELAAAFAISKSTASSTIAQCDARQQVSDDLRQRCQKLRGRVFGFSELAGAEPAS